MNQHSKAPFRGPPRGSSEMIRDSTIRDATFLLIVLLAASGSRLRDRVRARAPSPAPSAHFSDQRSTAQERTELARLLERLSAEDENVREHAATALGRLGDARAVPSLISALSTDPDASVREHVATALGRLRDGRAVDPLVESMRSDPSARVREHVASALGALAALERARRDPDESVRQQAAEALRKIRSGAR